MFDFKLDFMSPGRWAGGVLRCGWTWDLASRCTWRIESGGTTRSKGRHGRLRNGLRAR